ncbi:hypothetical protein P3S68_003650 [Capsicum galapagoense]
MAPNGLIFRRGALWNIYLKIPFETIYIKETGTPLLFLSLPCPLLLNPIYHFHQSPSSLSLQIAPLRSIYKVAGCLCSVEFQSFSGLSEASFMSEQAIFYLGSIGLLGEYCPWSRKKNRHFSGRVDCMHLTSLKEEQFNSFGCWEAQLALCNCSAEEFSEHS